MMKHFRLLTRTRQITEYSCGASALQAVLGYWGHDVDETELMRLIGTSEDVGTYPENIVRGVRALGLQAEARENLSLDEVQRFTADGQPMIALGQVWRSRRSSPASPEEDWDNGHYFVVLGVDRDYVYFQDPYLRMGKVMVTRDVFEKHWHQRMGGAAANAPALMHLGILIRGDRPAAPAVRSTAPDFGKLGSLNLMVTQFPCTLLPFDFMDELRDTWSSSQVRPVAFLLVSKDPQGNISAMEGGSLQSEEDAVEINAVLAALTSRSLGAPGLMASHANAAIQAAAAGDFGLSADDIRGLAARLAPDHSVVIVLFENTWERHFKDVVHKYEGALTNQRFVSPETLVRLAGELGIGAA